MAQCSRGLVFFLSISAVQWLCNADKKSHSPPKRLYRFFSTLYTALVSVMLSQSGLCLLLRPRWCILASYFKSGILSKCCSETEDWQEHPFPASLPACMVSHASLIPAVTPVPCCAVKELALQSEQLSWESSPGGFGEVGAGVWAKNWVTRAVACTEAGL